MRKADGSVSRDKSTSGARYGLGSTQFYSTPAVAYGRVYNCNTDGKMNSFASRDGKLAWSKGTGGYVYESPAVAQVPQGKPTVSEDGIAHSRLWHRIFDQIEFGRVPVVTVMHGAVIGGGLELAAATHIRVAERSAYYALPEGSRGIFVGGGGSVRLPRLIGVSRMMDLMLTGRTYGAEEGQGLGLSHYLVEPGEGLAKGIEIARRIAGNSPSTNFAIMNVLPRIAEQDRAGGYVMESLIAAITQGSDEAKKRIKDFLEKRAAKVERR